MWQRSDDWVGSQIDEQFVMVHIDSGKYLALNETANAVWQQLETPASVAQIVDRLTQSFEVEPDAAAQSVSALLGRMEGLGLVTTV